MEAINCYTLPYGIVTYLAQLQYHLWWHHSSKDTQQIIMDIEDYFLSGLLEGKSEEFLINSMGTPIEVAKSFRANNQGLRNLLTPNVEKYLYGSFLLIFFLVVLFDSYNPNYVFDFSTAILIPLVGLRPFVRGHLVTIKQKDSKAAVIISATLTILIGIISTNALISCMIQFDPSVIELAPIMTIIKIVSLSLFVMCYIFIRNHSYYIFSFISTTSFCMLTGFEIVLLQVNSEVESQAAIATSISYVFYFILICSAISLILIISQLLWRIQSWRKKA